MPEVTDVEFLQRYFVLKAENYIYKFNKDFAFL